MSGPALRVMIARRPGLPPRLRLASIAGGEAALAAGPGAKERGSESTLTAGALSGALSGGGSFTVSSAVTAAASEAGMATGLLPAATYGAGGAGEAANGAVSARDSFCQENAAPPSALTVTG